MSIKIHKKFSGMKSESAASVAERLRARNKARAEALAKAVAAKKRHEEEGDQVDDISMDADSAEVLFTDKDKNIQVLVGEDPVDGGIVVAVATAEKDNVEEEEVLASITVGEGEPSGETEESLKAARQKKVEEARAAIKARLNK